MSKQPAPPLRLVRAAPDQSELKFSGEQLDAIAHRGRPLILTGTTGTGKTTVLIEAALSRINSGQSPDSILVIAFGRERASEIRDAIVTRSERPHSNRLRAHFTHSLIQFLRCVPVITTVT